MEGADRVMGSVTLHKRSRAAVELGIEITQVMFGRNVWIRGQGGLGLEVAEHMYNDIKTHAETTPS